MTYELITLWCYRTGCVEHTDGIRNGLAFDLTHLDLAGRSFVRAALQLPKSSPSQPLSAIRLTDPSGEAEYGFSVRRPGRSTIDEIMLSPEAIADLQQAAGSFFSVDAACQNCAGDGQALSPDLIRRVRLVAVAAVAENQAAA
jgi:hypothetical protein